LTTKLSKEAVGFLEANRNRKFFLYLAYNAPHTPMQAPQNYLDKFASIQDGRRRTYAAMVHAMDDGVGMVLDALEQLRLRRNTLIFFLSDNGGPEDANGSCNDPLRGQKGQVFEGGIRVPFLASWPAVLPPGMVYEQPVISLDVSCTALAVGNADGDPDKLDGVNLLPYFLGQNQQPPHDALFWRQANGDVWAARSGDLKLLKDSQASETVGLYHMADDMGEQTDLAGGQPNQVQAIRRQYDRWNEQNQAAFFPSFRTYWPHLDRVYKELPTGEGTP
jgi:arylsulfatase A-like enzyme